MIYQSFQAIARTKLANLTILVTLFRYNSLTIIQWHSHSFKVGRAQSGPLNALIGCLNTLLEYFDF